MRTGVSIGGSESMALKGALLVYEGRQGAVTVDRAAGTSNRSPCLCINPPPHVPTNRLLDRVSRTDQTNRLDKPLFWRTCICGRR